MPAGMSENHGVIFMVSLKKYVPCKCGANNSFDFNSDMQVEDLTLTARCPSCGEPGAEVSST